MFHLSLVNALVGDPLPKIEPCAQPCVTRGILPFPTRGP